MYLVIFFEHMTVQIKLFFRAPKPRPPWARAQVQCSPVPPLRGPVALSRQETPAVILIALFGMLQYMLHAMLHMTVKK